MGTDGNCESSRSFEDSLVFGQEGEHRIGEMLIRSGFALLPLYQFSNHDSAPVMVTKSGAHPLPDLMAWRRACRLWVEVKRKCRWVHWDGRRETGFNFRLAEHYRAVQAATGVPVWVVFIHEDHGHPKANPTGVFTASLDACLARGRVWDGLNVATGGREVVPELLVSSEHLVRKCGVEDL